MQDFPLIAVPSASRTTTSQFRGIKVFAAAVAVVAVLASCMLNVFLRESYTGDEGFYGVSARNMLLSPEYVLAPSYFPAGDFPVEKDAFAHPPLNSLLYALAFWLFSGSLAGLEVINAVAFALLLGSAYGVLCSYDREAAPLLVLLLAASPAVIGCYSQLEAEPLMVTSGIAAWYCAVRSSFRPGGRSNLFVGGVLLGVSFVFKLWLAGPLFMAVATALCLRTRGADLPRRTLFAGWLLFGGGVVIPACLHLLAVAWLTPEHLEFWMSNIYLGVFTHSGLTGSKLGGEGVPLEWLKPVWYYPVVMYRDHFFLAPILLLGFDRVLQSWRDKSELIWSAAVGVLGVVPLSLMRVKEPFYVFSSSVFLYFLASIALSAMLKPQQGSTNCRHGKLEKVRIGLAVMLLLAPIICYVGRVEPNHITLSFVVVHTTVFILALAGYRLLRAPRRKSLSLIFPVVVSAAAIAYPVSEAGKRTTRDKVIADLAFPYLVENPPAQLSFIGSNFKSYQMYTFRRGCYWKELPASDNPASVLSLPQFRGVRVFIMDPKDQQVPANALWLRWLEAHATEKTKEVDDALGVASGYRVFMRDE